MKTPIQYGAASSGIFLAMDTERKELTMECETVLVKLIKCANPRCTSPTEFRADVPSEGNVCRSARCKACQESYMISSFKDSGRIILEIKRADF